MAPRGFVDVARSTRGANDFRAFRGSIGGNESCFYAYVMPGHVAAVSLTLALLMLGCSGKELSSASPPAESDAGSYDADTDRVDVDGSSTDASVTDAGVTDAALGTPGLVTRTMAAFPSRGYAAYVPSSYDGFARLPVILVLHGGGGNRAFARKLTCPGGDETSPECFDVVAGAKGFLVVYPDGTGAPALPDLRTWNAGGGDAGWQCVSGYACNHAVDERAYFEALLRDLATVVHIDPKRVFATGHSNGAALSERLACEMPLAIAGIAPVAGGNQYSTLAPCATATPVLEIHGTADPCWPFDGGTQSCADKNPGAKIGVPKTLSDWRQRNGCSSTESTTPLPDVAADGTTTTRHDYDCPKGREVVLLEVLGGGHTWPGGYARNGDTGPMSEDFSANHAIVDFFAAH